MSAEKYIRVPLDRLSKPQTGGLHDIYLDHWWAIDAQGNALFFKSMASPQCHATESMAKRLAEGAGCDVIRKVPVAMVKVNPSDFL